MAPRILLDALCALALCTLALCAVGPAQATGPSNIATDGTFGPAQDLSGPKYFIDDRVGKVSGPNQFTSFDRFRVDVGESVQWTSKTATNFISRVTGGAMTEIRGRVNVSAGKGGQANLFFLNPAGIFVGNKGRINVSGALHLSTADELRFSDGGVFPSALGAPFSLTSAAPSAFGFLSAPTGKIQIGRDRGPNPGPLRCCGLEARLNAGPGSSLSLSAGNILLTNLAHLEAPEGRVELHAGASAGSVAIQDDPFAPVARNSFTSRGDVTLSDGAHIFVDGKTGAGTIGLVGRDVLMTGEAELDAGLPDGSKSIGTGGSVVVDGSRSVTIRDYSQIDVDSSNNQGPNASVEVKGGTVTLDSGGIFADASGKGAPGNVVVEAEGDLNIVGDSALYTSSTDHTGPGPSDPMTLRGRNITIGGTTDISAGVEGSGDLNGIKIEATGKVTIQDQAFVEGYNEGTGSFGGVSITGDEVVVNTPLQSLPGALRRPTGGGVVIGAGGDAGGAVGPLKIQARAVTLDNGVLITYANENYPAAEIEVTGTQSVTLRNGSIVSSLKQDRASPGGNVLIQGGDVTIENSTVAADVHDGEAGVGLARFFGRGPPVGGGTAAGPTDIRIAGRNIDVRGSKIVNGAGGSNRFSEFNLARFSDSQILARASGSVVPSNELRGLRMEVGDNVVFEPGFTFTEILDGQTFAAQTQQPSLGGLNTGGAGGYFGGRSSRRKGRGLSWGKGVQQTHGSGTSGSESGDE